MTDEEDAATPKKRGRARRAVAGAADTTGELPSAAIFSSKSLNTFDDEFSSLIGKIRKNQAELENLQKEIAAAKEAWRKEEKVHSAELLELDKQEKLTRQRKQETYEYETSLAHKKAEDAFAEKKAKWEKELTERKEEIENDKKELTELRKLVDGFETEKERAVREVSAASKKELEERWETEKALREQEVKAEREILNLKIVSLTENNLRLSRELEAAKKALEEATRQVKEIALKVIEAGGAKNSSANESSG